MTGALSVWHALRACNMLEPAARASRRVNCASASGLVQFSPKPALRQHVRLHWQHSCTKGGELNLPARDSRSRCPSVSQIFGCTCNQRLARETGARRPHVRRGLLNCACLAEFEKEGVVCSLIQLLPCGACTRTAPAHTTHTHMRTCKLWLSCRHGALIQACPQQVMLLVTHWLYTLCSAACSLGAREPPLGDAIIDRL